MMGRRPSSVLAALQLRRHTVSAEFAKTHALAQLPLRLHWGWSAGGAVVGALLGLIVFAPARWVGVAVEALSDGRFVLSDANGSVWAGNAIAQLTGGPGSKDASALPGRLQWTLGLSSGALELRLRQTCCINGVATLQWQPGWGRWTIKLLPSPVGGSGQWPAAWLAGLGAPWNTLMLNGTVQLSTSGLSLESVQGRWRFAGNAELGLQSMSSRLSTLNSLGSYRLAISGNDGVADLTLSTLNGSLQLSGSGSLAPNGTRFRGVAQAQASEQTALSNLLNIIGQRDGNRSLISIG